MAKLSLSTVVSGFLSNEALTSNFNSIMSEFQNKVLYRDNPVGEPNVMLGDLDMNGHRLINVTGQGSIDFIWKGSWQVGYAYKQNNLVYVPSGTYIGYTMIAIADFTSSGTFEDEFIAGKWGILAKAGVDGIDGLEGPQGPAGAGSGDMNKVENLSGLANITTARANINAQVAGSYALSGANSDITSLSGLTTPLSVAQGGTGGTSGGSQLPIGSIYENGAVGTNPATLLGYGTWVEFGTGRMTVALNAGDPIMDLVAETGGSKDAVVVNHTHSIIDPGHGHTTQIKPGASVQGAATAILSLSTSAPATPSSVSVTGITVSSTGVSGENANMPPFITIYRWIRTV